ncbi:hypothetical protein GE061_019879 [Apolygus lucorum]|uniref:Uncharacterized protein n=1 Tax=Apolygus lucorum TaxID=248454 RepID=A0A8S9XCA9_APOLU|nr:hypothetical protein GE061_019879 [Apolygus lucorum]
MVVYRRHPVKNGFLVLTPDDGSMQVGGTDEVRRDDKTGRGQAGRQCRVRLSGMVALADTPSEMKVSSFKPDCSTCQYRQLHLQCQSIELPPSNQSMQRFRHASTGNFICNASP